MTDPTRLEPEMIRSANPVFASIASKPTAPMGHSLNQNLPRRTLYGAGSTGHQPRSVRRPARQAVAKFLCGTVWGRDGDRPA